MAKNIGISRFADRVNFYIDFQNSYEAARSVFHEKKEPGRKGTFYPKALANQIVKIGEHPRVLNEVRVYRGMPSQEYEAFTHDAAQRQMDKWVKSDLTVITRPLMYQQNSNGNRRGFEKGIDVLLALDLVRGAIEDEYDVAVVVSCDTDIVPAIERVMESTDKRVEVVGWKGPYGTTNRLVSGLKHLWAHWIDEGAYSKIIDNTNYTTD